MDANISTIDSSQEDEHSTSNSFNRRRKKKGAADYLTLDTQLKQASKSNSDLQKKLMKEKEKVAEEKYKRSEEKKRYEQDYNNFNQAALAKENEMDKLKQKLLEVERERNDLAKTANNQNKEIQNLKLELASKYENVEEVSRNLLASQTITREREAQLVELDSLRASQDKQINILNLEKESLYKENDKLNGETEKLSKELALTTEKLDNKTHDLKVANKLITNYETSNNELQGMQIINRKAYELQEKEVERLKELLQQRDQDLEKVLESSEEKSKIIQDKDRRMEEQEKKLQEMREKMEQMDLTISRQEDEINDAQRQITVQTPTYEETEEIVDMGKNNQYIYADAVNANPEPVQNNQFTNTEILFAGNINTTNGSVRNPPSQIQVAAGLLATSTAAPVQQNGGIPIPPPGFAPMTNLQGQPPHSSNPLPVPSQIILPQQIPLNNFQQAHTPNVNNFVQQPVQANVAFPQQTIPTTVAAPPFFPIQQLHPQIVHQQLPQTVPLQQQGYGLPAQQVPQAEAGTQYVPQAIGDQQQMQNTFVDGLQQVMGNLINDRSEKHNSGPFFTYYGKKNTSSVEEWFDRIEPQMRGDWPDFKKVQFALK